MRKKCHSIGKQVDVAIREKRQQRENVQERLVQSRRMTAGTVVSSGIYALDDPSFLGAMRERSEKKRKEEERLVGKRKSRKRMKLSEVKELRATFGHERVHRFEGFNKTQCGKYLQYKNRSDKEDGKMPMIWSCERHVVFCGWIVRPKPSRNLGLVSWVSCLAPKSTL